MLCDIDNKTLACVRCGARVSSEIVKRNCIGDTDFVIAVPSETPSFAISHGPGVELKRLLARVGITSTPDCSCHERAAEMDRQGVEWCEANLDTIVGWLREQATARGLPFLDVAGRMLVRRAIQNARRAAATTQP